MGMKLLYRGLLAGLWLFAAVVFTGCGSTSKNQFFLDTPQLRGTTAVPRNASIADVARFRVGETVIVAFSGPPTPIPDHKELIKEDGTITLPLIGTIMAAGKTAGQLQQEIYDDYVPKYYVRLTVTVSSGDRVYYVGGEVRSPGRQLYVGDTTVTKAIQTAGGLTDFANHGKIWLIHAETGKRERVNYDRALQDPSKDPPVFPNDQIIVERSIF